MIRYLEWLGVIIITVAAIILLGVSIYSFYYVITGKGDEKDAEDSSNTEQ